MTNFLGKKIIGNDIILSNILKIHMQKLNGNIKNYYIIDILYNFILLYNRIDGILIVFFSTIKSSKRAYQSSRTVVEYKLRSKQTYLPTALFGVYK